MAEENLKTKGTEVEEETGFWNRLNIPLPERSTGPFRYLRDFFTCLEFLTRIRMTNGRSGSRTISPGRYRIFR